MILIIKNYFHQNLYRIVVLPKFFPEKNKSRRKNIDTHFYFRMSLDCIPGFFHLTAPVNIMNDDK